MKTFKAIIGIGVLLGGIICAWKLLPVYLANYQFQDSIESVSRFGAFAYPPKTDEELLKSVQEQAAALGVPAKADDIHLVHAGRDVTIWANYTAHVNLPGFPIDLQFHPAAKNGEKIDPSAVPPQNQ